MLKWCCWGKEKEHQALLIHLNDDRFDETDHRHPMATITSAAMMLTSWLRTRHTRYIFLALCSPILIPFICASFPLLCAAEIFRRLRRSGRFKRQPPEGNVRHGGGQEGGRDESEGVDEVILLQRYLEDQLILVVGSVCDCSDDCGGDCGLDDSDDVEFLENSTNPLLPC